MNVRTCASFLTAAVLAMHAVTPAAQAPPASSSGERAQDLPTFRSDVRLIDIDVFVTDRDGNFVRDLTKDDFEIIEDGNVQDVKTFSFIDLPTESVETAGTAALPEPDVTTNDADGRIYVIIMDSPSTADPDESVGGITYTALAKRVARQFLDGSVMPGDQLAVVHAQGTFNDSQTFTTSRRLVSDSIDRYGRGMSGADNLITGSERVQRQLDSFRALQNVAERLGAMSGRRKAIVWIGAQMVFNLPGCPSAVPDCEAVRRSYPSILSAYRDAIGAATRNNVAIYPVDPSGLTTAMGAIELDRLSALRVVAEDTGGLAVVNTNNFAGGYEAILRDNSTYYVLGYSPATEHRDGKFHPVSVRVKRPGLTVRARKGYIAPESDSKAPVLPRLPEGVSEAAREALRQPLGVKGLSIALTAVPFKGTGKDRSVLVSAQITGADLQLAPGTGIAIAYQVFNTDGRVRTGEFSTFTLNLLPESQRDVARDGIRVLDRLALPPGRYELRMVADQPAGATGSVVAALTVPEFDAAIDMSGIAIASKSTAGHRTLASDPIIRQQLPADATAVRRFPVGDLLTAAVEVYARERLTADDFTVQFSVASATGARLPEYAQTLQGGPGGQGRWLYTAEASLEGMTPGDYTLTMDVIPKKDADRVVRRVVPFSVVAE